MDQGDNHPLRPICSQWQKKIEQAIEVKQSQFGKDADLAMAFFDGPYDFIYGLKSAGESVRYFAYEDGEGESPTKPAFCMTLNKVAEGVQLFGPSLYHRNPVRQVNPRRAPSMPLELFGDPNDPRVQQMWMQTAQAVEQSRGVDRARAVLLEHYLNYTPVALDLKGQSRAAIDEAIIKGLGLLWTEVYTAPGSGRRLVGSFYDTVDNLLVDPDAESLADAKWIARRCVHPYWEVERLYGLPQDTLRDKASLESYHQQSVVGADPHGDYRRKQGQTNDLLVYWKIWSKMGLGARLAGSPENYRPSLDPYGDFVFLALCDRVPWPLNLPPEVLQTANDAEVQKRVAWPTPFWADDAWPFTPIAFHPVPRRVWPQGHFKPAMGELLFLNWGYSFLAGKVKIACRDFIAIAKAATEDVRRAITQGQDYTLIEIEQVMGSIDNVVKFLQHPPFNRDIYTVLEAVGNLFDKRTGLTELLYGETAKQLRSAEEAQIKGDTLTIRPDDMANKVEDAMSEVARKEAFAARWHLSVEDVAAVLGPAGAQWWGQLVMPADPRQVLDQMEYRIEAGSTRKPNKARDAANMQQAMQTLFAPLFQYASATGDTQPVNALIESWAKSIDLEPSKFQFKQAPPPPEAPQGPGGAPPPEKKEPA